jgi:hypothetical protein
MDERDKWNVRTKEGYLKIHVAVNIKTKKKILLSMKEVTDDEHVHDDSSSKELHELVDNIIKSDSMTTTTTIDKLFADGGASMKAMRFLGICGIMVESCLIVSK